MDINQLLELLMQLLTQSPNAPAGDVPPGLPATGSPESARHVSPEQQMMSQLAQMAQQIQMQQSGQQMQNGAQGGLGAMYGSMGGRPRGS
jgi:hypothetical protein